MTTASSDVAPAVDAAAPQQPTAAAAPQKRTTNLFGIVKSCAANVSDRLRPAMPSLEAIRASPHYPVLVTPDPSAPNITYEGSSDCTQSLGINGHVIEYENELWKGRVMIHLHGLSTTNPDVFAGKKRLTWGMAQGQFKRPVRAADIVIGQEIEVPARGPSEYVIQGIATVIAHSFSKTCEVDVHGDHPHFWNPVLAACQLINVSKPGEEPRDLYKAEEDCRLLHPTLVGADGAPWPADKRRKWCDVPSNVADLELRPGLVYTFGFWQHFFSLGEYRVHAGITVDMCPFLCAQPLQILIRHAPSGASLLSLLVWHERLLYPEAGKRPADKDKKAAAAAGKGGKDQGDAAAAGDEADDTGVTARFKGLLSNWRS